jgi:hypothetical protein
MIGAVELGTIWQYPDFDLAQPALCEARVIEVPTHSWTAHDALAFDLDPHPEIPRVTHERAYTSPIWYASDG